MGKWLHKTLKPTDSVESEPHADIEDLARLVEGSIEGDERKRLLRHINRCRRCYEILQETMQDVPAETSDKPAPIPWYKKKSVYALAASMLLIFFFGAQLVYKFQTTPSLAVTAKLALDQELKDILLEDSRLQWQNVERIKRLLSVLQKKGYRVKSFDRVVLTRPYYQVKSLFGPQEILHIRIEDNVAYLEVKAAK